MLWLLRLGQALIFGAIAYTFTRFLIEVGVPLDEWGTSAGRAMNLKFDALLWGSVLILTLVMFWAEGRYSIFERLFYAVRPVKLSDDAMLRFTARPEAAQTLIAEGSQPLPPPNWQQRVVDWNQSVENLIRQELPPKELFSYRTITLPPTMGQARQLTMISLNGRHNKLRAAIIRLMPTHWERR